MESEVYAPELVEARERGEKPSYCISEPHGVTIVLWGDCKDDAIPIHLHDGSIKSGVFLSEALRKLLRLLCEYPDDSNFLMCALLHHYEACLKDRPSREEIVSMAKALTPTTLAK